MSSSESPLLRSAVCTKSLQCLSSSVSATLMKLVYGLDAAYDNDPTIETIEEGLSAGRNVIVQGASLVESLPFLRHMPSFMPFQREFARAREKSGRMYGIPFELYKATVVSAIPDVRTCSLHMTRGAIYLQARDQARECIIGDVLMRYEGMKTDSTGSDAEILAKRLANVIFSGEFVNSNMLPPR